MAGIFMLLSLSLSLSLMYIDIDGFSILLFSYYVFSVIQFLFVSFLSEMLEKKSFLVFILNVELFFFPSRKLDIGVGLDRVKKEAVKDERNQGELKEVNTNFELTRFWHYFFSNKGFMAF
ncbi:hypothetical protein ACH5RR_040601 [Cinchona calisaya]|uniref:ATP synthase F0 subunit 8 n=1 Tax=Cinchona calisaya TaxID=153742 RepID=A0ABD2XXC4_9GENT